MATRRAHLYFGWLLAVVFLAIGIERALRGAAIGAAPDAPLLLLASVLLEAIGALAAAAGLFAASRLAVSGLALFAGAVLFHLGADVLVYHVRAVIDAAFVAIVALGLAALGWIALDRSPRPRLQIEIPTT
jgi:hypothetical protein